MMIRKSTITGNRTHRSNLVRGERESPTIKILHIVGLAHGGVGQHILSLVKGCDASRFESTVAMATDTSALRPNFEQVGIRVLPLDLDHYGGIQKNIVAFRQLAGILRSERFDVIQTHTSVAGAVGRVAAKLFTRTPVVHMIHAFAGHPRRSAPFRAAATFVERRLDRWTDFYIAGSRAMVERGISLGIFSADKVELISNGVDLTTFDDPSVRAHEMGGSAVTATQGEVTVGFLGRLEKQKGAVYLVRAAAMIRARNPRIRFVIAGDGSLRPQLQRLASELRVSDGIEFVGWTRDAARFLKQIDILAMPSLWEAFGLSAAEAMAARKPVVASSVEGLREVIEDGRTGILVPPADPQALASAIVELADDLPRRQAMGRNARERVEERFSLKLMISRHEQFYERLADSGRFEPVSATVIRPRARNVELSLAESQST